MFGAYDLFAKMLPGTIFFLGILSLFPSITLSTDIHSTAATITLFTVIIFVFGFMTGQALHSVAVSIENQLYIIGKKTYSFMSLAKEKITDRNVQGHTKMPEDISKIGSALAFENPFRKLGLFYLFDLLFTKIAFLLGWLSDWIVAQLYGLLVPHRVWFKNKLNNQFNTDDLSDPLYDWFKLACRDHLRNYELDIPERHSDVYRFVMSYLEFMGNGRARQFQATSSFCRSMWITLLTYSIIYSVILINNGTPFITGESMIESSILSQGAIIPTTLFIISVLFMISTKQYKKHFTEYIVVDFYTSLEMNMNKDGEQ